MPIDKSCQLCWKQKIQCMLGGSGPLSLKRPCMEEVQTLRPLKKLRSEPVVAIQAPKKPEVYLKVKWNYSFCVWMASLVEMLVSEMVRRQEVEERTVAALERLMLWIKVMDSSQTEKSWRSQRLEKKRIKTWNIGL